MSDWLHIARNQAEERGTSLPLPSGKDENFRFTPMQDWKIGVSGLVASLDLPKEFSALDEEEAALLKVDGEDGESFGEVPGALFTDLLRAVVLGSESVRSRLRDGIVFRDDKFAQLAAARWKNGAFFHVPAGVKISKPVRVAWVPNEAEAYTRNLIVLEEGAEAVLVQESWTGEQEQFLTELTEVKLGKNAKLHWVILQRFGRASQVMVRQKVELAEGASLKLTPLHLGARKLQVRQHVEFQGPESNFETVAAARGDHDQHYDFWLDMDHAASRTESQMEYSFVMADRARAVFNGLIQVKKEALHCVAAQKAKSLLLSTKASVHAIPKLIIQTDEVKCNHGASVSSVNPEQLHYLQSRGIPRAEAERMIVRGFTESVVARFPTEALHDRAESLLDEKQGGVLQ